MKKGIIITIIVILIIGALGTGGYFYFINQKQNEPIEEKKPEMLDTIDSFGYKLEDRDTELFKEIYEELKNILLEEKIDYSKYAELLSKLYIIDLYTINNKISKYDVGGADYIYPDSKENFELKVRDTMYKYVEDNSNNSRNQDLPEVKLIQTETLEEVKYTLNEKKYDGYKVNVKWEYTKEEDYDKETNLFLIKDKNKLYIVEQKNN